MSENNKVSKALAYVLRHDPSSIGIELDEHGWADVEELVSNFWHCGYDMTYEQLEEIVRNDEKQRYSFNADRSLIRANQGHSIPVDVGPEQKTPPGILYHGTATRFVESIDAKGLLPMGRLHVHLSNDVETAVAVGRRHGEPFVYAVDAAAMSEDGFPFFLSENGVWLVDSVPPSYLSPYPGD